ncbi:MAG: N-acetylmuramoyl-L-alanine amidase [Coriobacteriales bacterium]|nr:N-acetylmuramoyl-L-alanine amidase [Coriobacteriales bacterium]
MSRYDIPKLITSSMLGVSIAVSAPLIGMTALADDSGPSQEAYSSPVEEAAEDSQEAAESVLDSNNPVSEEVSATQDFAIEDSAIENSVENSDADPAESAENEAQEPADDVQPAEKPADTQATEEDSEEPAPEPEQEPEQEPEPASEQESESDPEPAPEDPAQDTEDPAQDPVPTDGLMPEADPQQAAEAQELLATFEQTAGQLAAQDPAPAEQQAGPISATALDLFSVVYINYESISLGDTNDIVFIMSAPDVLVQTAQLTCVTPGYATVTLDAYVIDNAMRFSVDTSQFGSGSVALANITLTLLDGRTFTVALENDPSFYYGFTVEDPQDLAYLEPNNTFYAMDTYGSAVAVGSMEAALDASDATVPVATSEGQYYGFENGETPGSPESSVEAPRNIVIALDPGHSTSFSSGATHFGVDEHELTIKIAQYCKAELEKYKGVTVYMTRTTAESTYPDVTEMDELRLRVEGAKEAGADVFVSIHLNSYDEGYRGAQVYYPNRNTNSVIQDTSAELAQDILNKLVALGIDDGGIRENGSFSNGLDYYNLLRNSKANGIPGVIVEHCFLSDALDYTNWLSTEEGLKSLGVADAEGIANYFGLSKTKNDSKTTAQSGLVTVSTANSSGEFTITADKVTCTNGVQAVSCGLVGPDGTTEHWYALEDKGNGTWSVTVNTADFGNRVGNYTIQTWVCDADWAGHIFFKDVINVVKSSASSVSQTTTATAVAFRLDATYDEATNTLTLRTLGATSDYSVNDALNMAFAVTGSDGKTVWYEPKKQDDGSWTATVDASDLASGKCIVEAWGNMTEKKVRIGSTITSLGESSSTTPDPEPQPQQQKLTATVSDDAMWVRVSSSGGKYAEATVVAYEVTGTKQAGSSPRWLQPSQKSDGTWYYNILASSLGSGTVTVNTWAEINGTVSMIESTTVIVPDPSVKGSISYDSESGMIVVKAQEVVNPSGITFISIGVTGPNGTERWCKTTETSAGTYEASFSPNNFGSASGTYNVLFYVCDSNWAGVELGTASGNLTFEANEITGDVNVGASWTASSYTLTVRASGSKVDQAQNIAYAITGQSGDTLWYQPQKQSDGSWTCGISALNHDSGPCVIEVWATFGSQTTKIASGTTTIPDFTANANVTVRYDSAAAALIIEGEGGTPSKAWSVAYQVVSSRGTYWVGAQQSDSNTWQASIPVSEASGDISVELWANVGNKEPKQMGKASYYFGTTPIASAPTATAEQLAQHYKNSNRTYPASVYKDKGAATIDDFCKILYDEATAEGINPAVVYSQIMVETGYLGFGGDVDISQCNFSGIGATGNGAKGNSFTNVRLGIRATVQHLKAYANNEDLVNACIDPRFEYIVRGRSPYVETLSNYWATSGTYGKQLVNLMNAI